MKMTSPLLRCLGASLTTVAVFAFAPLVTADTVLERLQSKSYFSTLVTAIEVAGLSDALSDESASFTVLAPTNAAFEAVPEKTLAFLLDNPDQLADLLLYHVLGDEVSYYELESGSYTTLAGTDISVDVRRFFFWFRVVNVNNARVTRANLHADNGVVHTLDAVLDPEFMETPTLRELLDDPEVGNYSTLDSLLDLAGYSDTLDAEYRHFTLLAPSDEAFAEVPEEALAALADDLPQLRKVLRNHIAPGAVFSTDLEDGGTVRTYAGQSLPVTIDDAGVTIGGATVENPDVEASNGVLHGIDAVLLIAPPQSIVDVAETREDLSTFVTALDVAGLTETFDQTRKYPSYTVFVPSNAAFDALPEGVLSSLVADPEALGNVLGLHVVRGRFASSDLRDGQVLHALNGGRLTISIGEGGVSVNEAGVAEVDIQAANGIIHVIDAVIAEDPFTVADFVASNPRLSTLNAALGAADLAGALDGDGEVTLFAPLNSAFDKLPEGTVEALLNDIPTLSAILTYHVVGGTNTIEDLAEAGTATTLQGDDVTISTKTFRFWFWTFTRYSVNGVHIYSTNIETDNGIVHIIADVLIPPESEEEGDPSE